MGKNIGKQWMDSTMLGRLGRALRARKSAKARGDEPVDLGPAFGSLTEDDEQAALEEAKKDLGLS